MRSNQHLLIVAKTEARSNKLCSDLLRRVEDVFLKGSRKLPGFGRLLLVKDQTRLLVSIRGSLRLGRVPVVSTSCVKRI